MDCPDCKRLLEAARDAIQSHIKSQSDWQVASLRREDAEKIAALRALQDKAAGLRLQAVSAYRDHALTHAGEPRPLL
jgi:hypothetical protein